VPTSRTAIDRGEIREMGGLRGHAFEMQRTDLVRVLAV